MFVHVFRNISVNSNKSHVETKKANQVGYFQLNKLRHLSATIGALTRGERWGKQGCVTQMTLCNSNNHPDKSVDKVCRLITLAWNYVGFFCSATTTTSVAYNTNEILLL